MYFTFFFPNPPLFLLQQCFLDILLLTLGGELAVIVEKLADASMKKKMKRGKRLQIVSRRLLFIPPSLQSI